jgi:hypothetical protein
MILTLTQKKLKNLAKYKDLEFENSRKWKVRTKTVPVINDAIHTIKK